MITAKEYFETCLGGNMNIATLKPIVFIEILEEYAQLIVDKEKIQFNWIPVWPRTPDLIKKLESTDARLIQCLFDTGEILAFNDDHPFAIMTHYYFLPEPPNH